MIRIAHLSDPHISAPLPWSSLPRLTGKQLLGWLNWVLHRSRKHNPARLRAAVAEILRRKVDRVIVTGDLCQLGHEEEVGAIRALLHPLLDAGIPTHLVSGNHDLYGGREHPEAWWALRTDLAQGEAASPLRLSSEGWMILLADMAVPTPLFQAWGEMATETCSEIESWLAAAPAGTPILLAGHFPIRLCNGWSLPATSGLRNADVVSGWIETYGIRGYLCGHVHAPYQHDLGHGCTQYCAGSISAKGVIHVFEMEAGGLVVETVRPEIASTPL